MIDVYFYAGDGDEESASVKGAIALKEERLGTENYWNVYNVSVNEFEDEFGEIDPKIVEFKGPKGDHFEVRLGRKFEHEMGTIKCRYIRDVEGFLYLNVRVYQNELHEIG